MYRLARIVPLACLALTGCVSAPGRISGEGSHEESCAAITEGQVAALFDQWNAALASGDADDVVKLYAPHSILLPTVSNQPRFSVAEKRDYFVHFLEDQPRGSIDRRFVEIGCNSVVDAGLYTFRFERTGAVVHARYSFTWKLVDRRWRITSHHSSAMPEKS